MTESKNDSEVQEEYTVSIKTGGYDPTVITTTVKKKKKNDTSINSQENVSK